jgi:hypothetical protein
MAEAISEDSNLLAPAVATEVLRTGPDRLRLVLRANHGPDLANAASVLLRALSGAPGPIILVARREEGAISALRSVSRALPNPRRLVSATVDLWLALGKDERAEVLERQSKAILAMAAFGVSVEAGRAGAERVLAGGFAAVELAALYVRIRHLRLLHGLVRPRWPRASEDAVRLCLVKSDSFSGPRSLPARLRTVLSVSPGRALLFACLSLVAAHLVFSYVIGLDGHVLLTEVDAFWVRLGAALLAGSLCAAVLGGLRGSARSAPPSFEFSDLSLRDRSASPI